MIRRAREVNNTERRTYGDRETGMTQLEKDTTTREKMKNRHKKDEMRGGMRRWMEWRNTMSRLEWETKFVSQRDDEMMRVSLSQSCLSPSQLYKCTNGKQGVAYRDKCVSTTCLLGLLDSSLSFMSLSFSFSPLCDPSQTRDTSLSTERERGY